MKMDGFTGSKEIDRLKDHLGVHVLIELYGCSEIMSDCDRLQEGFLAVANASGATVVNTNFHQFSPHGISGVVVIQESHLTIHTWPEYEFAAIDIFTCSSKMSIDIAVNGLVALLEASSHEVKYLSRGERAQFKNRNPTPK